jgi:hypothetical protein
LKIGVILDGSAFSDGSLTLIRIPSSIEAICEFSFSGCKSLEFITHDPGLKLRPTLSGLLAGRGLPRRFSGDL